MENGNADRFGFGGFENGECRGEVSSLGDEILCADGATVVIFDIPKFMYDDVDYSDNAPSIGQNKFSKEVWKSYTLFWRVLMLHYQFRSSVNFKQAPMFFRL